MTTGKSASNRENRRRMHKLIEDLQWACGGPACLKTVYSDERYSDYTDHRNADEWFLHFLTWGPWGEDEGMCARSREELRRLTTPLGRRADAHIPRLVRVWKGQARRYPSYAKGAEKWLLGLNRHLRESGLGMRAFETRIRQRGWVRGRESLRVICGVTTRREGKALDCWIRDRLNLDSFPIDTQVRRLLELRKLPDDPAELVRLVKALGWNPRVIARAANSLSPELVSWG